MSESIGEKLRKAREEKRLTIAQVAEQTRLRPHYIEALERDDLSTIPSAAQARGFLRIYIDFLGLSPEAMPSGVQPSPQTLAYQPSASSADSQVRPVQPAAPAPEPAQPNLLTSLRERFTRRNDTAPISAGEVQAETESVESKPVPAPEPEPFVPIRHTEELPAAPEPPVAEIKPEEIKTVEEPPAEKISTPPTKPAKRKTAATNSRTTPVSKTKSGRSRSGLSKTGGSRTVVKKKITPKLPEE